MIITPKITVYRDIKFDCRSAARWAVAFDAMKIAYVYEPFTARLPPSEGYIPDFYLPDWRIFCEVKDMKRPDFKFGEVRKMIGLVHALKSPLLLLDGAPGYHTMFLLEPEAVRTPKEYQEMDGEDQFRIEDFQTYLPDLCSCSIAWSPLTKSYGLVASSSVRGTDVSEALNKARDYAFED